MSHVARGNINLVKKCSPFISLVCDSTKASVDPRNPKYSEATRVCRESRSSWTTKVCSSLCWSLIDGILVSIMVVTVFEKLRCSRYQPRRLPRFKRTYESNRSRWAVNLGPSTFLFCTFPPSSSSSSSLSLSSNYCFPLRPSLFYARITSLFRYVPMITLFRLQHNRDDFLYFDRLIKSRYTSLVREHYISLGSRVRMRCGRFNEWARR